MRAASQRPGERAGAVNDAAFQALLVLIELAAFIMAAVSLALALSFIIALCLLRACLWSGACASCIGVLYIVWPHT